MSTPFTESNILDSVESYKMRPYTHSKFHFKSLIDTRDGKAVVNHLSIFDKYFSYFEAFIVEYEMTDEEEIKYAFQPKKFCYDKFENIELWSLLLRINNMTSSLQFDRKKIKTFDPRIEDLIAEIMILEEDNLLSNALDVETT